MSSWESWWGGKLLGCSLDCVDRGALVKVMDLGAYVGPSSGVGVVGEMKRNCLDGMSCFGVMVVV